MGAGSSCFNKDSGFVCAKGGDSVDMDRRPPPSHPAAASRRLVVSSRRADAAVHSAHGELWSGSGGGDKGVLALPAAAGEKAAADLGQRSTGRRITDDSPPDGLLAGVPNGFAGEHVAAGWPPWLVTVAAEAVKGWLPRKAESFQRLDKIGQGTYSNVFKARDLATGKLVALKKIQLANLDPESVRFMAREITILRELDHPNVVKLECLVASKSSLFLVFEYMDHDLAGLSAKRGIKFSQPQIKCYMKQILHGLEHCHSHGVLHRDIKGPNLLINNDGILKIADFGLATFYNQSKRQPLTSRVVTLWYRPPELLLGETEYDGSVDLWGAGCILAEMFAGKPIMTGRTEVEQLHKIFKLCGSPSEEYWRTTKLPHATVFKPEQPYRRRLEETFKDFPPTALGLLDSLLAVEPDHRGTAAAALESEFFTSAPVACDPASLPKYPPCKEYDVKLQNEAAKSHNLTATKGHGSVVNGLKSMATIVDVDAAQANREKWHVPVHQAINIEYTQPSYGAHGFPVGSTASRRTGNITAHSGPLMYNGGGAAGRSSRKKRDGEIWNSGQLSNTPPSHVVSQVRVRRQQSHQGGVANSSNPKLSGPLSSISGLNSAYSHRHDEASSSSSLSKDTSVVRNESARIGQGGYGMATGKKILFSGPLMPPGGNMDEMLEEHERQVQQAIRWVRRNKARSKIHGGGGSKKGHPEAMLFPSSYIGSMDDMRQAGASLFPSIQQQQSQKA